MQSANNSLTTGQKDSKTAPTPAWIESVVASVPELAKIDEVATLLRISRRTVSRKIATGEIAAYGSGVGSARVVIPRDSLRAYLSTLAGA